MKKSIRKIISIALTFILLFSTTSFSTKEHNCEGSVFSFSFFFKGKDCGMYMDSFSTEHSHHCTVSKESCCLDFDVYINGATALENEIDDFSNDSIDFLTAIVPSQINLLEITADSLTQFKNYRPPLIVKDVSVLYEVFQI